MTRPALRLPLTALPLRPGTDVRFGERGSTNRWKMSCLVYDPSLPRERQTRFPPQAKLKICV